MNIRIISNIIGWVSIGILTVGTGNLSKDIVSHFLSNWEK